MAFELPETLPDNADDLRALRGEAVDAFNSIYNPDRTPTEEEFADMKALTDAIAKLDEAMDAVKAAMEESARSDEAAAMAEAANKKSEEFANEDEDEDNSTPDETEDEGERKEEEDEEVKEKTDFTKAATGKAPEDLPSKEREEEFGWRLTTAAANQTPGIVDDLRVAREFGELAQGRASRMIGANGRSETTLAYFDRNVPDEFTVGDSADAIRILDRVTDESRLDGGSLTAAGGWVAPSERVYDFLPTASASGLLSLPELSVRRGGIAFPVEPDFGEIYSEIGFHQTEAEAQAGEEKPCFEIPDAAWDEVRLDVLGICITAGILQDKAWPELTRKYVNEALRLHLHKVSAWRIGKIVLGSTNVGTLTGPMFGTAGAVLSALELQVADMRARHRLGRNQSVEGIAPEWLLSVIRADLAYRESVLPQQVTDENVQAHFRNLGANIQFVADWQVGAALGGDTPATEWPPEVQVVLYPAGTWWGATEPVINLGIVHDSTLLKQNRQIQMFTEDGVAVGKRGPESRLVTIPLNVDGTVGARYAEAAASTGSDA